MRLIHTLGQWLRRPGAVATRATIEGFTHYSVTYEPSETNTDPWRCRCGSMTFVATGVRNPRGDGYTLTSTRCARCGTAVGVTEHDCNKTRQV